MSKNQLDFGGLRGARISEEQCRGLIFILPCLHGEQNTDTSSALAVAMALSSHPLLLRLNTPNQPLLSFLLCWELHNLLQ